MGKGFRLRIFAGASQAADDNSSVHVVGVRHHALTRRDTLSLRFAPPALAALIAGCKSMRHGAGVRPSSGMSRWRLRATPLIVPPPGPGLPSLAGAGDSGSQR